MNGATIADRRRIRRARYRLDAVNAGLKIGGIAVAVAVIIAVIVWAVTS